METINVRGKLKFLAFGKTQKDNREMYRFTIEAENLTDNLRKKFDEVFSGASMIPNFVKEKTNSINLKTQYDIDVRCEEDDTICSLEKFIENGCYIDSEVVCKIKLKKEKNAIYPCALLIKKLGSKYDMFADME